MIDAVIFDCDGVLADTEPLHDAATREELAARGFPIPDSFFEQAAGMRTVDQIHALGRQFDLDPTELFAAREARFWGTIDDRFREVAGTAAAVRQLHDAGLPVAVASSGTRRWVDYVTTRMGVNALLSASVTGDDVTKPKPDPQPYLRAASKLNVEPSRCAVVEAPQVSCHLVGGLPAGSDPSVVGCLVLVGRDQADRPV
ncbi:HAD family phosphatase [Gordonia sp. VNQ95]|uniref:HAD family hydrolase n=1 Tax=Gordonia sp. VNQ95 TaxID=3156619 RepID=UPI0032B49C85